MNAEQRRPQVGDKVWFQGVVDVDDRSLRLSFRVHFTSDIHLWLCASDITTAPPAPPPPRPEWEIWRDVAKWFCAWGWGGSAELVKTEADRGR